MDQIPLLFACLVVVVTRSGIEAFLNQYNFLLPKQTVFFPNQTFAIQPSSKSDSACQRHELQPHLHASPEGNHAKRLDRSQSHHAISISLSFESTFTVSLATPEANKSNKSDHDSYLAYIHLKEWGYISSLANTMRDAISSTSMPLSRTAVPMPTPNNGISNKTLDVHALPR